MLWIEQVTAALIAFLVVLLTVPLLAKLAIMNGWADVYRRVGGHTVTPTVSYVGGIAVVLGLIAAAVYSTWVSPEAYGLAAGIGLVLASSLIEKIAPNHKTVGYFSLIMAATITVIGGQHMINLTGGSVESFDVSIQTFALPLTIAIVSLIVLAFRILDRADGLCDGQALVSTLAMISAAVILKTTSDTTWPLGGFMSVALPFMAALLALTCYTQRRPGRRLGAVFLGKGGALAIGLIVAWLGLKVHAGFGDAGLGLGVCLWLFVVPLSDLLFLGLRRLFAKDRGLIQDTFLVYHWLRESGYSTTQAVAMVHAFSALAAVLAITAWQLGVPDFILIIGYAVAFGAYALFAMIFWSTRTAKKKALSSWEMSDTNAHNVGKPTTAARPTR